MLLTYTTLEKKKKLTVKCKPYRMYDKNIDILFFFPQSRNRLLTIGPKYEFGLYH